MIDKFCEYITNKIRKEMPEVDDEKAEVIKYGLQLLFGELPKLFILAGIALVLGVFKWTIITFGLMLPYRMYSGGFHLKTHIGCMIRNFNNVYRKCIYESIYSNVYISKNNYGSVYMAFCNNYY